MGDTLEKMVDVGMEYISDLVLEIVIYPVAVYANHFVLNAKSRFFYGAILIGLLVCLLCKKSLKPLFNDKSIWWSDSAKIDYQIAVVTPLCLMAFGIYFFDIGQLGADLSVNVGEYLGQYLTIDATSMGGIIAGIALTLTLFIAGDFRHWLAHYLFHKIPALWELHKVHHSAEVLNFVTAERFHPLETLINTSINVALVGMVNIIFIALFGTELTSLTLLGANAIYFTSNLIGGTLRHSPIYFSYGAFWERYLISPAMHQIHHSTNPRHFDKNFGGALSIWDRLFGTVAYAHNDSIEGVGLGDESKEYHTLWGAYVKPIIATALVTKNAVSKLARRLKLEQ